MLCMICVSHSVSPPSWAIFIFYNLLPLLQQDSLCSYSHGMLSSTLFTSQHPGLIWEPKHVHYICSTITFQPSPQLETIEVELLVDLANWIGSSGALIMMAKEKNPGEQAQWSHVCTTKKK